MLESTVPTKDTHKEKVMRRRVTRVSFSSCQRNLIKTFQIEGMIALIKKNGFDFFMRLVKWPKIAVKKCQNLIFKVNFQRQKSPESF